jgi:hypothetical protein
MREWEVIIGPHMIPERIVSDDIWMTDTHVTFVMNSDGDDRTWDMVDGSPMDGYVVATFTRANIAGVRLIRKAKRADKLSADQK